MEKLDFPFLDWSEENNKIKSRFLCSKETIQVTKMDIPQKIEYYKGHIQKVKDDYKKKIGLFKAKNKQHAPCNKIILDEKEEK